MLIERPDGHYWKLRGHIEGVSLNVSETYRIDQNHVYDGSLLLLCEYGAPLDPQSCARNVRFTVETVYLLRLGWTLCPASLNANPWFTTCRITSDWFGLFCPHPPPGLPLPPQAPPLILTLPLTAMLPSVFCWRQVNSPVAFSYCLHLIVEFTIKHLSVCTLDGRVRTIGSLEWYFGKQWHHVRFLCLM